VICGWSKKHTPNPSQEGKRHCDKSESAKKQSFFMKCFVYGCEDTPLAPLKKGSVIAMSLKERRSNFFYEEFVDG
jgi:hypothetical protein